MQIASEHKEKVLREKEIFLRILETTVNIC